MGWVKGSVYKVTVTSRLHRQKDRKIQKDKERQKRT